MRYVWITFFMQKKVIHTYQEERRKRGGGRGLASSQPSAKHFRSGPGGWIVRDSIVTEGHVIPLAYGHPGRPNSL